MKQFIDGHAGKVGREGDDRRTGAVVATDIPLFVLPRMLTRIGPLNMLLSGRIRVNHIATQQAPRPRQKHRHAPGSVKNPRGITIGHIQLEPYIEDREKVEVRQAIQKQATIMVIRATKHHVAAANRVATGILAYPPDVGDHFSAKPHPF